MPRARSVWPTGRTGAPTSAERAWGTVREDYSANGDAWRYFPHDHARSRAYRWNEDGLGGFCNRYQNVCLALALWNEQRPDPQGATLRPRPARRQPRRGRQGVLLLPRRHADARLHEDALQVPPGGVSRTTSWSPRAASRTRDDPEYELIDALGDDFRQTRTSTSSSSMPRPARTTSSAGSRRSTEARRRRRCTSCRTSGSATPGRGGTTIVAPSVKRGRTVSCGRARTATSARGTGTSMASPTSGFSPRTRPTPSASSASPNAQPYVKDAFHQAVVSRRMESINPAMTGTKAAAHFHARVEPGASFVRSHPVHEPTLHEAPFDEYDATFLRRIYEADEFHATLQGPDLTDDDRLVQRQALAGLLWSKQFYHYGVELWLDGDPRPSASSRATPGPQRQLGAPLHARRDLACPTSGSTRGIAAWDLAFHCIPLAMIDPSGPSDQLILLLSRMVHAPQRPAPGLRVGLLRREPAGACLGRAGGCTRSRGGANGQGDVDFLEAVFHKLLLNFTWWVNRKDADGNNVFEGGFLGLDNIGVFDRSKPESARRRPARTGRRHRLDGHVLPEHAGDRPRARRPDPPTRTWPPSSSSTSSPSRTPSTASAARSVSGTSRTSSTTTRFETPTARRSTSVSNPWCGLVPLFAVLPLEPDLPKRLPRFWRRWSGS